MNKKAVSTDMFMAVIFSVLSLALALITLFLVINQVGNIQEKVYEDSISLDVFYDTRTMLSQELLNGKTFQEQLVNSYNNDDLESFYVEVELFVKEKFPSNKIIFIYIQGITNKVTERALFSYWPIQAPVLYIPNPEGNAIRVQVRVVDEEVRGDYLNILGRRDARSPINANLRNI